MARSGRSMQANLNFLLTKMLIILNKNYKTKNYKIILKLIIIIIIININVQTSVAEYSAHD